MARRFSILSIPKLAFPSNFVFTFRPVCLSFPVMTVIMYVIMITRNCCHIQHKPNIFLLSLEAASLPHLDFATSQFSVPTPTLYHCYITHLTELCSSSHYEEARLPESMSTAGHAVTQLIEALSYKPEGRRFDSG
jgi:hypothetical protein